jgi:hypothetical protein
VVYSYSSSKLGMAENLVTNLIAFTLVGNVGGDDTAKYIRATAACATLGYNLIRILVVVPLKTKFKLYGAKFKCILKLICVYT